MSGVLGGLILKPTSLIPRNGLVAEYLFNNNVLDTSGNSYDGIANALTYDDDRHSNPNSAGVFNGSTSYINIDAALAGLATTTVGTNSLWLNASDVGLIRYILAASKSNDQTRIALNISSGQLQAFTTNNTIVKWNLITDNIEITTSSWIHIAEVKFANNTILYINAIPVAQTFLTSTDKKWWYNDEPLINTFRIGALKFNSLSEQLFYAGLMDDIRIYNRTLSQAEITALKDE